LGVKFAICNEMFENWDLRKVMALAARLGYSAVEIAPFTLADDVRKLGKKARKKIVEDSESLGVEIAGTHWLLVKPEGLHITHPDQSIRGKTVEYLKALAEFTADIGGRVMVFGSPKQRNVLPGVDPSKAWAWAVEAFKKASRYCGDLGVTLCIEPLSRDQTNFINTCRDALKLIEDVAEPSFKLILDVRSMADEGRPIHEIVADGREHLTHFHANDTNGLGPGFGKADYHKIARTLLEIGFSGYASVEIFDFTLGSKYIATRSIENLKTYFGVI